MATNNFDFGSEEELDIICNRISMLSIDFDQVTKVSEEEDNRLAKELANHKPMCYYMMNNDSIEKDKVAFKRPD